MTVVYMDKEINNMLEVQAWVLGEERCSKQKHGEKKRMLLQTKRTQKGREDGELPDQERPTKKDKECARCEQDKTNFWNPVLV
tara:strand:- start:484 stop:732 length:249 start_codon:yes stop_codon:yes gene_type:complete